MPDHEDDEPLYDVLDLTRLPCLQHVQLVSHFYLTSIPESIKTLNLRDVLQMLCVELLLGCRNLVNFEAIDVLHKFDPRLTGPVIFPNLERFRWSNGGPSMGDDAGLGLIRHIQLPALRSLVWADDGDEFSEQPSSEDPRCRFFAHLPPSLSSLTLVKMSYNPQNHTIPRLLIRVPQVSELHLVECPVMIIEIAAKVIGQRKHGSRTVLPNLRKLTITSSILAFEDINLQEIVGMLEALHATKSGEKRDRFHLHINVVTKVWNDDEHFLGRLRALVKDGFDLEVCIRSHVLDLGSWSRDRC
ncbi:hypothetical protein AGABI2DRAFT_116514 [Agaricus bisporus var. bisporus H97]|uniref:hypothetical protein n=1 Tax=Agaricus bisporus var. bisporus (strain H97 / ATCC MYA-4626 / FGSC 10389) TaxID=936046 RepID=UPI00029F7FA0|nr:hypothetical protein AGABI2DRAFT_116514 [Agaricus bisporus var. bisporus H97]EKV49476.1 hypothetical protein AGABI2DRAFT_116514 [Agaricus bisporus var. bisporus H97]